MADDDRHGRRDHVGRVTADHDVHFIDVEQLGVDARNGRRVGLVIVINELYRPTEKPALGVDLFLPDLHREQRRFAVRRQAAGQRHAKADRDRVLCQRRDRSRQQQHDGQQCASQRPA
jgi:hypothetical protein